MPRLLIVHHTPSPGMQEMLEAVVEGAGAEAIGPVDVRTRPALSAGASDLLDADAVVLGTPANIGYMSGALKHFFDGVYYPCLEATTGLPYCLYVHGASDTTGAVRAVESVALGMSWQRVRPAVELAGPVTPEARESCREIGAVTALAAAGESV